MFIIGLTGPIGSGKSVVSGVFKEHGFYVIDTDQTARRVVYTGSECIRRIAEAFGSGYINLDGSLKRRELGDLVFSDPAKLEELNKITHPVIIKEIKEEINTSNSDYILIEAPALIQSGADTICDAVVTVIASVQQRVRRITERDNLSSEQAQARVSAQPPDDIFINMADYVIRNESDIKELKVKANKLANEILSD